VEMVKATKAASLAASVYEKIRNAVELRDERVLRRGAIERILIRRLGEGSDSERVSEFLVREVLWAGYLGKEGVPISRVDKVGKIIEKYLYIIDRVKSNFDKETAKRLRDWLVGVCSAEIDRELVCCEKEDAIVGLMYQLVYDQVELVDDKSEQRRDVQVYLAVQRALFKMDDEFLRFLLLKIFYPEWLSDDRQIWEKFCLKIAKIQEEVEKEVKFALGEKIKKYVAKMVPSFLILEDVLEENCGKNKKIFMDDEAVEKEVEKVCEKKYSQLGRRLKTAVVRSIIYIFLTKMLIGLLIEFPYDRFILKNVDFLSLGINAIFPPFLMFMIGTTVRVPSESNTDRIVARIKSIAYQGELFADKTNKKVFAVKEKVKRPLLTSIFVMIYLFTFVLTFGIIYWVLELLNFSIVSMGIFYFFLTAVVFFGYRVRLIAKEYTLVEKDSILTPVVDFFFVPILRVGSILSDAISRINFFSYILDFIIEARVKTIIEVIDEWIRFMREKREEVV